MYNSDNNTISLKIGTQLFYTGDYSLKFIVNRFSIKRDVFFKIRLLPKSSDVANPALSSHDLTSCEESIYPFLYGFDEDVFLEDMTIDSYGNLLLAGYG